MRHDHIQDFDDEKAQKIQDMGSVMNLLKDDLVEIKENVEKALDESGLVEPFSIMLKSLKRVLLQRYVFQSIEKKIFKLN